jgi:hypothetical protein
MWLLHFRAARGLFVPKPSWQVAVLAHPVPDLLVNVRRHPPESGDVHAGCHSASHSVRTTPLRRYAGSPVARMVITRSRSGPVRSSSPIRTARSLVWMM